MAKPSNGKNQGPGTNEIPEGGTQQAAREAPASDTTNGAEGSPVVELDDAGTLSKKLSVKEVVGDIKKLIVKGDIKLTDAAGNFVDVAVMTIQGYANSIAEGFSNFGMWEALEGDFQCINLLTGETFQGSKAFVPDPAGKLLVEQIRGWVLEKLPFTEEDLGKPPHMRVQRYRPNGQEVQFALVIAVAYSEKAQGGYEYKIKPLVPVQASKKMQALTDMVRAKVNVPTRKALAAPST